MRRAGYVLVGGKSTRMGRDKALLPVGSGNLAQIIAASVATAAGTASLIGDPYVYGGMGYPVFPDLHPGFGPIAGLETALRLRRADWNLVVACDLPHLPISFLKLLILNTDTAKMERGCVVAVDVHGEFQPLCAVYHVSCLELVEKAVADRRLKMNNLLRELEVSPVPAPDFKSLFNANTPDEWAEVRTLIA